jgi:hypothetical protein
MHHLFESKEIFMIFGVMVFFMAVGSIITWFFISVQSRAYVMSFEGIVGPFLGLPAVLFSLTTALMATSLWENYDLAKKSVRTEVAGIATIIDLAEAYPKRIDNELANYAKQYAKSIAEIEWGHLSSFNHQSAVTKHDYETLRQATYKVIDSMGNKAESEALRGAIESVSQGRMSRITFTSFDVHSIRWFAIIAFAVLVQLVVALVHITKPKALMTAMAIATVIVIIPIVTIGLTTTSPYVGLISISNAPYLQLLK